jgi:AraC family transcriptional regulator
VGFETMGDRRVTTCQVHSRKDEWPQIVVERRTNGAGSHADQAYPCNEIIVMTGGRSIVRRTGDGFVEHCVARAGTAWTGPIGFVEKADLSNPIECIHLCLPSNLISRSALIDFDIDPAKIELSFAGGFVDRFINDTAQAFSDLLMRPPHMADRLFVDGMTAALVAHIIASYTIDRWTPSTSPQKLDGRRLQRVLDYIDGNIGNPVALHQLAAEASLSPFHFARLFRDATGLSPHRYVTERRVNAAKDALASPKPSLNEIALDSGFGSLDNFIRVFRKKTGLTPGQYRKLSHR